MDFEDQNLENIRSGYDFHLGAVSFIIIFQANPMNILQI